MKEAFIIDYQRTPVGRFGGALSGIRPDDLATVTISALLQRNPQLDPAAIDEVIFGCANQSGEDNRNVARFAALLAGLPVTVPAYTVNRLCASGMQSAMNAFTQISSGMADVVIAGGVESMSRAPYVIPKPGKAFDRSLQMADTTLGSRFMNPAFTQQYRDLSMGETGEQIAERWQISRARQDEFAWNSHMKYVRAASSGTFDHELIGLPGVTIRQDENVRPDTSIEKLATLKTVFKKDGTVTAGNAAGLNDGAAAMLIVSEAALKRSMATPIARIVSIAAAGVHPDIMGTGPIPATRKLLKQAGLTIRDIDLFEINEAYAVQVLCCIDELGIDPQRVNVNGGALAIGHPLGASGNRILGHLALELKRRKGRYGIATMCVGVGQGTAVLIENI